MKKIIFYLLTIVLSAACSSKQEINLQVNLDGLRTAYIKKIVEGNFENEQYTISDKGEGLLLAIGRDSTMAPQSYRLRISENAMAITGADLNGIIYGTNELVEHLKYNGSINDSFEKSEKPSLPFRAIKYNLPWFAYRSNEAITIHEKICRDIEYWEKFLDMMAENRFNALTLWNLHPFSRMIRAENFPYACEFKTDEELSRWQTFYRKLFRMAAERGIETYIVNWNIFVSQGFADRHNLARLGNISVQKGVDPETAELAKTYNKESVTQVLNEYPDLTGIGLSLGEAMGGMTAQEREDWIMETIIAGMQEAERPAKLIHRVPFSAGLQNSGSTSITTEKITRNALERIEGVIEPIWLEAKFNWSHAHSTPKLIKVHGGELKDTYWNPPTKKFKMNWMIRNEDFFILRWGAPPFIRKHIELNAKDYIGGYYVGSECYIPAADYMTKIEQNQWEYAFERQWLFYKLWGRLLYNPETPDEIFKKEFVYKYGEKAEPLLKAYSIASKMPLHYASFIDVNNDKSLYSEGILARYKKDQSEFLNINLMIEKGSLDPDYLSIKEFVNRSIINESIAQNEITPLELADSLNEISNEAMNLVKDIDPGDDVALLYEIEDVKIWSKLADYFAEKLRGGVSYYKFQRSGNERERESALKYLNNALAEWDKIILLSEPIYRIVPLTHLHYYDDNKFHWSKFRKYVERDIEIVKKDLRNDISILD